MQPLCDPYLAVLVELQHQLLTGQNLHDCYSKVLERIGQVIYASRSYVVKATEDTTALFSLPIAEWCVTPIACAIPPLTWQKTSPHPTLSGWAAALRRGEILVDALPVLPRTQPIHSATIVLLPLMMQGKLYGAIVLEHCPEKGEGALNLKPSALQMLQGVATALSLKLEQMQQQVQLKELTQQIQQLHHNLESLAQQHTLQLQKSLSFEALLRRITDRVRDSLDERQILQTAVQELATGLGVYSCDAALYNLEQGTSTIAYEYINCEEILPARGTQFQLADYPEVYPQLLRGQYLQFCWIAPPDTPRNPKTQLAVLGCPIIDDQGVIGDLWLYDAVETYFELEEVRLIEQVANQCAIALRQARLYQESQAQVQKLEQLNYLKDDFLNTVSHELRSPMANIEMATQMLEMLLFKAPCLTGDNSGINLDKTNLQRADNSSTAEHVEKVSPRLLYNEGKCYASLSRASSPERLNPTECTAHIPASSFQQALRYFRMLQDECVRETNLINDLLDLSRLEAGTEPIFLTPIQLQAWIPHVVEPFLERARNRRQNLQTDIPEDLPLLSTDLSGLERILTELLHNACKYTPSNEEIRISARLESTSRAKSEERGSTLNSEAKYSAQPLKHNALPALEMLVLRVSNSGVEIPPLELPRIFDKFYRLPSNDPWKQGGTGLGLALVKRLVEHLGATIEVDSSQNQVTFTIGFAIAS